VKKMNVPLAPLFFAVAIIGGILVADLLWQWIDKKLKAGENNAK